MAQDRKVIAGGWVLTLDRAVGDFPVGDVLVEGSEIVAVGPRIDVPGAERIEAAGMIVLPGFVDTHRHTWQSCVRHRYGDMDPQRYFAEMLGQRGAAFRPEDVRIGTQLGCESAPYRDPTAIQSQATEEKGKSAFQRGSRSAPIGTPP